MTGGENPARFSLGWYTPDMHPADLIPVLKSLHADPRTAGVFSDWFEDRGEVGIAHWLRRPAVADMKGPALIRSLSETWFTVVTPEVLAGEAFERMEVTAEIEDHFRQVCVMSDQVAAPVGGTRANPWQYFEVAGKGPMVFPVFDRPRVPRISDEGMMPMSVVYRAEHVEPRRLIPLCVEWPMLDGNQLQVSAVIWCGTLSNGTTVFGRVRKEHLTPHPRRTASLQHVAAGRSRFSYRD